MTLSTYHLPVIFPDEAVVLNYKGFQSPPQPKMRVEDYLKYPEGESGRVHSSWGADAHKKAMEFVENNRRKDAILRGYIPSTNTVNRRDSKKPLYRSPEYADALGSKLYGGVVTTREGQQLLVEKLQQRIQSLNDLDASAFGAPSKEVSAVLAPPTGLETQPIDDAFVELADSIQSGYINPSTISALQKANSAIVAVGPYLDSNQIAEYIRINDTLTQSVFALQDVGAERGAAAVSAESKRLLNTLQQGLERQRKLLEDLNKKAFYSVADKKLLLSSSQRELLPTTIKKTRLAPFGVREATRSPDILRSAVARRRLAAIRSPPAAVSREPLPVGLMP